MNKTHTEQVEYSLANYQDEPGCHYRHDVLSLP